MSHGGIYVGGSAFSFDFPTTSGAFQTTLATGSCGACGDNGFVTRIVPSPEPGYAFSPTGFIFPQHVGWREEWAAVRHANQRR